MYEILRTTKINGPEEKYTLLNVSIIPSILHT